MVKNGTLVIGFQLLIELRFVTCCVSLVFEKITCAVLWKMYPIEGKPIFTHYVQYNYANGCHDTCKGVGADPLLSSFPNYISPF